MADTRATMATDIDWRYTTKTFKAVGHVFCFRSTDPELGQFLDDLYEPCAVKMEPQTWYSIIQLAPDSSEYTLFMDEERLLRLNRRSWVVRQLTWQINQEVIRRSSDHVLLHAAAAAHNGSAVLLPGAPEAGKTTLVAGLVRAGFDYLTDEAAAIDPRSLLVEPYAKPLSIDPGSWLVLAELAPGGAESAAYLHEGQWHVNPGRIRPDAVSGRAPISMIAFPRFVAGAPARIERLRRSEALAKLLRHTFRFRDCPRRNFDVLARVVDQADCYELTSGDLHEACQLVTQAVDGTSEQSKERGP